MPSVESDASLSRADTMSDNEEVNQSGVDGNIRTIFFLIYSKSCALFVFYLGKFINDLLSMQ